MLFMCTWYHVSANDMKIGWSEHMLWTQKSGAVRMYMYNTVLRNYPWWAKLNHRLKLTANKKYGSNIIYLFQKKLKPWKWNTGALQIFYCLFKSIGTSWGHPFKFCRRMAVMSRTTLWTLGWKFRVLSGISQLVRVWRREGDFWAWWWWWKRQLQSRSWGGAFQTCGHCW